MIGDVRLADRFARFARLLSDDDDREARILGHVVEGASRIIPGVAGAAVLTVAGHKKLQANAVVGDDLPGAGLRLQNELGEGPCLEAIATGQQILVADLSDDDRWPRFAGGFRQAGAVSMLCTPLVVQDRVLGVLTLIGAAHPHQFDDEAVALADIFAAHAGVALSAAHRHDSLNAALIGRDVIGQAKGILMERFRYTPDQAFSVLVKASSDSNTKLRTVCEELCLTGTLAEPKTKKAAS